MFGTDDNIPVKLAEGFKFSLCDDECPWLHPKERNQNKISPSWKLRHWCFKHNQQVFHGPMHPGIIAVKGCEYSIKGDRKCQKETSNASYSEIAQTSPQ
jgi:hypothetical protein